MVALMSLTSTEIGSIWHSSLVMLKIDALQLPLVNIGPFHAFLLSSLGRPPWPSGLGR